MQRKLDRSILSRLKTEVETQLRLKHGEQMKSAHLERMKDRVVSDKQVKALKSKVAFLTDVLREVQKQHESISGYMKMLSSARELDEMVGGTLKLMTYEEMTEIDTGDSVMVNQFCKEVFNSCQKYLDGDVDLRLETEMEDDETLLTNQECLQRILTNLIRNSMQFTHEGEIVLEVKHHQKKQEDYLMFTISDTGLGIPDGAKDIAFERMTDTDISIKNVVVRLRQCYAMVRLLGGSIFIDPSREKGTSIAFTVKAGITQ